MSKNSRLYLDHIAESIALLEMYLSDSTWEDFQYSKKLQDLTCRRLEIIGEAVKNLPDDFRNKYPQVKWKSIAGLRDILIHQYFSIDTQLLWNVIANEIPEFKKQIQGILISEQWNSIDR